MAKMGRRPVPAIQRFRRYAVLIPSGCIEWTGTIDRDGYGQFTGDGGRLAPKTSAHRWSYEYHIGPIPPGLYIDHLCRNRRCVNPTHLEPVTPLENVMRGIGPAAINANRTHCVNGHLLSGDNIYPDTSRQRVARCARRPPRFGTTENDRRP